MKLNKVKEVTEHAHTKKKKAASGKNTSMFFRKKGSGLFSLFWIIIFNCISCSKIIILILGIEQDIYF